MTGGYENPSPDAPVQCGRYQLLERIGYGGMAEVFRARLPGPAGFEKFVVVKRILPRLTDDRMVVRMFIEEAKIAAAADHDNIAQVFELGQTDDGKYFMVMEYIRGVDLEVLLSAAAKRSLRVPPWFSVHAVSEVLEALDFVHSLVDESGRPRNVIHRDATPSNIFVSYKGEIKLSDFGVADFEGKAPTTRAGQLKGKLSYMSPEQLNGNLLDKRTDIFTIGVVLWEALTQQRLFGGLPEMQAMMAICEGERRPPSQLAQHIPPELDRVVLKALAIERDNRYSNAGEFQSDLIDALHVMHRAVRQRDVQDILRVLLGRQEPTGELLRKSFLDTGDGDADGESSFLLPLDEGSVKALSEVSIEESVATETGYEDTHLHEEMPLPAGLITLPGADMDSSQEPTLAVDQDRVRRAINTPPQGTPVHVAIPPAATPGLAPLPTSHVFWLRSRAETRPESYDYAKLTQRLANGAPEGGSLSADGTHWISIEEYAQLTGQDSLLEPETAASRVAMLGSLKDRSLVSVFGILARDHSSGTLSIARSDTDALEWYEVHVQGGRPTRVITNLASMQFPQLLLATGRVPSRELPGLVHNAVLSRRSLNDVAKERGFPGLDPFEHATLRLKPLFEWRAGDFTFTMSVNPPKLAPIAGSLISLLPRAVASAFSEERLLEKLGKKLRVRNEPSWRFEDAAQELTLDPRSMEIARALTRDSIGHVIERFPGQRQAVLALAYLLIEADLLVEALEDSDPLR